MIMKKTSVTSKIVVCQVGSKMHDQMDESKILQIQMFGDHPDSKFSGRILIIEYETDEQVTIK